MNYTSHTYDTCMNSIASELAVRGLHALLLSSGYILGCNLKLQQYRYRLESAAYCFGRVRCYMQQCRDAQLYHIVACTQFESIYAAAEERIIVMSTGYVFWH